VVTLTQSLHNKLKDKGIRGHRNDGSGVVDASLARLDQGELITIPSLPDMADWKEFEARKALGPNLSRNHSAAGYGIRV
jgi:hypothetical protein